MTSTATTAQEWIAHDPDPETAAELSACSPEELEHRFSHPLTFGTAGLRGPLRGGPDGMNLAVVLRTTWAVAQVLKEHGLGESQVVVGRDARHKSDEFALAAAEVLAAEGFEVQLMLAAVPTPVVAFAVRHMPAVAGIQITASHNPKTDNGYKVFVDGGMQITSPTDHEIEEAISRAPHADEITRAPVTTGGLAQIKAYLERAARVRRRSDTVRVAFTPMHGVGGEFTLDAMALAGLDDVHVVESQFNPDPEFPTVEFPNPEEPGATDELLALAERVGAEIAIALDPRRGPVCGRNPHPRRMAHALGRRNRLAAGRLHSVADRTGDGQRVHGGGQHRRVVTHAGLDRRGARRPSRRDAHGLQVAGARRISRHHIGVRVRGGHRALRRPVVGPRQGWHHRRDPRV